MGSANKDIASILVSLYENVMLADAADIPPAIVQDVPTFSSALTSYIKSVENAEKKGHRSGKWYPYRTSSTEINVGYGHKINPGEDFSEGLTNIQVDRLLQRDLATAAIKARHYVNHNFGKDTWENLDKIRQEMLLDFVFNLGSLDAFPKFTKAVVYNDVAGMRKEYMRSAIIDGEHKLIGRNQVFFDTFLANYHGGYYVARL